MNPDVSKVPVFILCGDLGTRLREETELRPKPMVPIAAQFSDPIELADDTHPGERVSTNRPRPGP